MIATTEKPKAQVGEFASLKVVEVPPGPPVLSTLLAEIYGPDAATRRAVAGEVEQLADDRGHAVDLRHDDPRVLARLVLGGQLGDERGPAADDVERGAELVRDAGG